MKFQSRSLYLRGSQFWGALYTHFLPCLIILCTFLANIIIFFNFWDYNTITTFLSTLSFLQILPHSPPYSPLSSWPLCSYLLLHAYVYMYTHICIPNYNPFRPWMLLVHTCFGADWHWVTNWWALLPWRRSLPQSQLSSVSSQPSTRLWATTNYWDLVSIFHTLVLSFYFFEKQKRLKLLGAIKTRSRNTQRNSL